jgi:predicted enzyme related to lactoylglutathione lyase
MPSRSQNTWYNKTGSTKTYVNTFFMQKTAINYIEFACKDIPGIKAFYSKAFGWEFTDYGPDYAAFSDGKTDGGFFYAEGGLIKAGNPLVVLYNANLEDTLETVKLAGGTITQEIFPFPGGRRFHFADPDGNVLAVWSE